jgi:hypothetical protein
MRKKENRLIALICISLIIACPSMFLAATVGATDGGPVLGVEPSSIVDTTIAPNATFSINITIANVSDLFGCQILLSFAPAVLQCTSASLPADHIFADQSYSSPLAVIDNTAGTVSKMVIIMGIQPGINVSKGTLCRMTFKVKIRGTSNLTFTGIGMDTYMIDSGGHQIDFTPQNGYFSDKLPTPTATIQIDPSRVVDPSLTPCHNFTENVTILTATELHHWQLSIYFRNDILNATDVTEGPFLKSGGSTTFNFEIFNEYNATHGRVEANSTLAGSTGVTGNGTLMTIIFHVLGLGNTSISLHAVSLYDSAGDPIPYITRESYFNNQLMAKLHVIPEEIVGPQWLPYTNFTIDIAVEDVENLYGYEFKLGYDGTVLTCFGLLVNSPQNETHFTTSFTANDTAGEVWVKTQYYPPAVPITTYPNTTLITLFFRVDRVGESQLHLFDTQITDPDAQPIVHETTDGYFATLIVDVAIVDATAFPSKIYQGWKVNVTITVLNKGNLTETFDVHTYYDNSSIETSTVNDLAPGEQRIITFLWNTANVTPYYAYNYTIRAEIPPLTYEINTSDNYFTDGKILVRLLGDINGDGVVELMDFSIMTDAYGSYPGHPRWNPECDLNQDGRVELMDFMLISNNYLKRYDPHP